MRKIVAILLVFPALWLVATFEAFGLTQSYTIVIVISGDQKEYNQAFNGIVHCPDWTGTKISIQPIYFDPAQSLEIGRKLVRIHPDLIFTIGTQATKSVTNIINDIPVIFCMVFDKKIIEDLKGNGNQNVFGIDGFFPAATQLEMLKKILPDKARIGILYHPQNSSEYANEASLKAKELNMDVIIKEVLSESDVLPSLESIKTDIDVLLSIPDKIVYAPQAMKSILLFSLRNKIPLVGLSTSNVSSGALFSLFCDYSDVGCQAAGLALEILKGKKLPKMYMEEPRKKHIAINVRTAEVTEVQLPQEIVDQAAIIYGIEETR